MALQLPTLAGFTTWVYTVMGVPQAVVPPGCDALANAFAVAQALVNPMLANAPDPIFMLATYNLAGDNLVNWAPDVPGQVYPTNNPDGLLYFAYLRQQWDLTGFIPGVVNSSADEGTSQSLTVPSQLQDLTILDLQHLKTPWGRTYMGFAQSVGTLWGIS
jgi:hypothetical protein